MIRLSSALWLLLVSGCATSAQHPEAPPPSHFLPPPFVDRPLGPEEEALDAIISALAEQVLARDLRDVPRIIESRTTERLRIEPVTYTFGVFSDQAYVMSDESGSYASDFLDRDDVLLDERLDGYVHFGIREPRMGPFVPTVCRERAKRVDFPRVDFLMSPNGPHTTGDERYAHYFDVLCDGRVRLKLFINDVDDPTPYLTQVVIYAEPR